MRVVIIGAGNVASVFGRLIKRADHEIIQVVSRNIVHARLLGVELECAWSIDPKTVDTTADLYIVAISDTGLQNLRETYFPGDRIIVHTAGSVSKEVLKDISVNYGVLYPLQSLRKEKMDLQQDIPLLIDGSSAAVVSMIQKFALTISSTVTEVNDEQRLKLHLAAVFVSNFTNYLYSLAADYCSMEGLDFKMLQPLMEETALRTRNHHPAEMQTGPATRKDSTTLNKHVGLLAGYPILKKVYEDITNSIINRGAISNR